MDRDIHLEETDIYTYIIKIWEKLYLSCDGVNDIIVY